MSDSSKVMISRPSRLKAGEETIFPEGRVVAIDLSDGQEGTLLWDSQKPSGDEPERPRWRPFLHLTFGGNHHDSWKHFVDVAYWNVELSD